MAPVFNPAGQALAALDDAARIADMRSRVLTIPTVANGTRLNPWNLLEYKQGPRVCQLYARYEGGDITEIRVVGGEEFFDTLVRA